MEKRPINLSRTMMIVDSVDYKRGVVVVYIPAINQKIELGRKYFSSKDMKKTPMNLESDDVLYGWSNLPEANEPLYIVVTEYNRTLGPIT